MLTIRSSVGFDTRDRENVQRLELTPASCQVHWNVAEPRMVVAKEKVKSFAEPNANINPRVWHLARDKKTNGSLMALPYIQKLS